jgi:hypothetical protein
LVATVTVALFLPLLVHPTPSGAVTVTGSATRQSYIAFTGDTTLNTFPCGSSTGCGATFNGRWEGYASGVHGPSPYEVAWTTGANSGVNLTASVQYFENCIVDPTGLAAGHASGTGAAHIGGSTVVGTYWRLPGDLPRLITGVHLYFDYKWNRVGNTALVSFETSGLVLDVQGLGPQQVITGTQAALVAFVARPVPLGAPTCATPAQVQATVGGIVPLVDRPLPTV